MSSKVAARRRWRGDPLRRDFRASGRGGSPGDGRHDRCPGFRALLVSPPTAGDPAVGDLDGDGCLSAAAQAALHRNIGQSSLVLVDCGKSSYRQPAVRRHQLQLAVAYHSWANAQSLPASGQKEVVSRRSLPALRQIWIAQRRSPAIRPM